MANEENQKVKIPRGHKLINEHDAGIEELVDELEAAYQKSLKHNKTTENDMEYLRRYMFTLNTLLVLQINDIASALGLKAEDR